jgi:hypothetical protein
MTSNSNASYGFLTDFVPSVKFEDGHEPTEVLSVIKLYFRDFYTFDPTDLLALLSVQAWTEDNDNITTTRTLNYLHETFPQRPNIHNTDVIGTIICILENYAGQHTGYNIQGNIHQCIFYYGVHNNDSSAAFGNSLREYLHDANKLKQHIDDSTILHMLDRHFQQNHQIDGIIRARITTMTATQSSIADIIRTLQGHTIQHACPSHPLPTTVAASSIPTTMTLSPSQLHA